MIVALPGLVSYFFFLFCACWFVSLSLPHGARGLLRLVIVALLGRFLTLLLLNTTCPVLANSINPDQLASEEAN